MHKNTQLIGLMHVSVGRGANIHVYYFFSNKTMHLIIIAISRFLKRYLKAKRTRVPANSRALRQIKRGGFPKGGSREAQVRFPEYQEGTE